ncbi:hypothetical protein BCR42DRAFT_66118 [Absidia repens]|uniref:Protein phosphatase 1 regulatory subunit 21 N-terminal domain-containing protein n=1 Tax=Absidia repens TaxID=90262 RepID=A0A1X2IC97_9FUNG|nr:hypothetical protein BCR42DRAFT_66118 [Absidia repens]
MTDSIIARHTQLNAGAMPASAEELAQKHQSLFQEYSRLKAQHTVLKKAVKKERMENASLQGNVKEKEKELRKLQGQLDILAFHNERLSKRIEAVQEVDTVSILVGGRFYWATLVTYLVLFVMRPPHRKDPISRFLVVQ